MALSIIEHGINLADVTEADAQAELDRLLGDPRFRITDRHRDILRYLAELHFNGVSGGAKAYSIAVDVLGRTSDFEPSLDPIVRIEMSRLRSALDAYYSAFGQGRSVRLELPRGCYMVRFGAAEPQALRQEPKGDVIAWPLKRASGEARKEPIASPAAPGWDSKALAAMALCIVALSVYALWALTRIADGVLPPGVSVRLAQVGNEATSRSEAIRGDVEAAMLKFGTVAITSQGSGSQRESDYQVEITYAENSDRLKAKWSIVDNHNLHLLDAGVEEIDPRGLSSEDVQHRLALALAIRVADWDGAIGNAEMQRAAIGTVGNVCTLRAYRAVRSRDERDIAAAVSCLESTIAATPRSAVALAFLSKLTVLQGGRDALPHSLELAERAVAYNSSSDVAQLALSKAEFARGRLDAAVAVARRAYANNPANAEVAAALASYYFSRGEWDSAAEMSSVASRYKTIAPVQAALVKALDAYRKKEWRLSARLAEEVSSRSSMAQIVRTASLGKLSSSVSAIGAGTVQDYRDLGITVDEEELIKAQRFRDDFTADLEDGLRRASADRTASTP